MEEQEGKRERRNGKWNGIETNSRGKSANFLQIYPGCGLRAEAGAAFDKAVSPAVEDQNQQS